MSDPKSFHDFERAGWESNVDEYDAAFARLTRQAVEPLLDAAGVRSGTRLLDVACGPGYVTASAAKRGASVTGVDFSGPMVVRARAENPGIDFQEGDAESLAFAPGTFDSVVMSFGMLHLARPERAMSEAARVLKPSGRFAFTVWEKPEVAIGFGIMLGSIKAHGNMDVPVPEGPPFFRFSDPAECERTLRAAGFTGIKVVQVSQTWRFGSPDELFEAIFKGGVRIRAVLKGQTAPQFEAIRAAACKAVEGHAHNGGFELPMPSILASATRAA